MFARLKDTEETFRPQTIGTWVYFQYDDVIRAAAEKKMSFLDYYTKLRQSTYDSLMSCYSNKESVSGKIIEKRMKIVRIHLLRI